MPQRGNSSANAEAYRQGFARLRVHLVTLHLASSPPATRIGVIGNAKLLTYGK
jgi:hypothetical protein